MKDKNKSLLDKLLARKNDKKKFSEDYYFVLNKEYIINDTKRFIESNPKLFKENTITVKNKKMDIFKFLNNCEQKQNLTYNIYKDRSFKNAENFLEYKNSIVEDFENLKQFVLDNRNLKHLNNMFLDSKIKLADKATKDDFSNAYSNIENYAEQSLEFQNKNLTKNKESKIYKLKSNKNL